MTQPFRTASGGRIRRDLPLRFTFNGQSLTGYQGDTLASALLAHGIHLTGRSFKYHRPRGILTAGPEEPNALVTLDRGEGRLIPNTRATTAELHEGLTAISQNAWPSLRFDLGALAGCVSPLLGAGFYYKTFLWPAAFWKHLYEPAIRAAAGLGRAPVAPDPDRYLTRHAHCDVLVIGAGPAGLAAARAAAARGDRVILCDEQTEPGGSLLSRPETRIDGLASQDWIAAALNPRMTLLTRTTAFGWYPGTMIALAERITDHLASPHPDLPRERLWLVRAKRVVLAAGAIERPAVFPGNDRPGILLAGAAASYWHRYGVLPGSRIVVATSHDGAWHTALALVRAGGGGAGTQSGTAVAAILDRRGTVDAMLHERARAAGIAVHLGARITGTRGRLRVRAVETAGGPGRIACDTVLMSDGWTPSAHLFSQSRGRLRFDPDSGTFLPGETTAAVCSVGACAGEFGLAACLADGNRAGGGGDRTFQVTGEPACAAALPPEAGPAHARAFVDFQNDVTTKDLVLATREGFRAIEHVKRYTTAGMATDQGKTSNLNALASVAALTGRTIPEIGLTTFRPPYTPVTFGAFAGTARGVLFDPVRRTPIDDRDAVFEDVGTWKRAHYFPRGGETMASAAARECLAVRNDVGMCDASTLGKIEVAGPDAAAFLNRLYTGDFTRLAPGRCKYGVLLGEDGFIRDDGVVARLAPDRFHVTTTTGNAAWVLNHLEDYLQTEFSSLRVWLTSTTEHWACIALQGPRAAALLAPFLSGIDLTAMPHMSVREGRFLEVPIRLFRVSFTGEPGFEINLPARFARSAWNALRGAGAMRYGTEAMHVLRAEKGFVLIGQETDGTVVPDDLGLGWTIAAGKPDFVGKRSLMLPAMRREDRGQLVGLLTDDPALVLEEGARVTEGRVVPAGKAPGKGMPWGGTSVGHVTSAYHSAALGRSIALALVSGGRKRMGEQLFVPMPGGVIPVTVTGPVFLDPGNARMTGAIALAARPETALAARLETVLAARPEIMPLARPEGAASAEDAVPPRRETEMREQTIAWHETAPVPAAVLTLLPPTGKFNARSQEPLAPPLRAAVRGDGAVLWLGPDEYLILAEHKLELTADSVVDVSDRTVGIRLEGPRAAWCLNVFCPLDLEGDFPDGACARTLLGKAEIVLWRRGDMVFQIEVARSLTPYVLGCLEEARREFRV